MDLFGLFKPKPKKMAKKKDLEGLVKALQYKKDKIVRKDAAFYLGKMGDARAVKPLQKTLQTDEKGVRESVARALGEIGNDDAVDVLIDCLKGDPDYVVQAAAASALGSAGNKLAVEPLIESLGKCEPYVRSQSAKALGDLGDRAAVEPLIKALEDEEYFVKNAAAIALCKIGDKRGLKPLIEKGGKQPIRLAAKIGDYDSVRYLTSVLEEHMIDTFYSSYRKHKILALDALEKIGDINALDQLLKSLKDDDDSLVRKKIPAAISQFEDARTIPALLMSLKNDKDDEVRMYTAWSLAKFHDDRVFQALVDCLRLDKDSQVKEACADSLLRIGDDRTFQELMNIICNESPNFSAFIALAQLNNINATPVLIDYIFEFKPQRNPLQNRFDKHFQELFGAYNKIIFDSVYNGCDVSEWWDGYMTVKIDYKYDLKLSEKALETLLELKTPISSNLLHKISNKKDEKVITGKDPLDNYKKYFKTLNFIKQRETAAKELEKRGNPPYDSSIYLVKDNWKI